MKKNRPFLKWAGNKFRCIDIILSTLPKGNRLIEPFAGSAAVFLNSQYPQYLLAEQNQDLVVLYEYLQKEGSSFIAYCNLLFSTENNHADVYYQLRKKFNQSQDTRERAALFLYLNRHGYNGLCRYNKQGIFNVPFGRYDKPYFPAKEMQNFHMKSQSVTFLHEDFRKTFLLAKPDDVIYCDPPYVPLSDSAYFSSYTSTEFGNKEQIELAELAMQSAKTGIKVIISNHDTEFTREYYKEAKIYSFPVLRHISCKAKMRGEVQELVAIFGGKAKTSAP